jgi:hypothetical protein
MKKPLSLIILPLFLLLLSPAYAQHGIYAVFVQKQSVGDGCDNETSYQVITLPPGYTPELLKKMKDTKLESLKNDTKHKWEYRDFKVAENDWVAHVVVTQYNFCGMEKIIKQKVATLPDKEKLISKIEGDIALFYKGQKVTYEIVNIYQPFKQVESYDSFFNFFLEIVNKLSDKEKKTIDELNKEYKKKHSSLGSRG